MEQTGDFFGAIVSLFCGNTLLAGVPGFLFVRFQKNSRRKKNLKEALRKPQLFKGFLPKIPANISILFLFLTKNYSESQHLGKIF